MEFIAATLTAGLLQSGSYSAAMTIDSKTDQVRAEHAVELFAKVLGAMRAKFDGSGDQRSRASHRT